MVTKQQQLEWLAKELDVWPGLGGVPIRMSSVATGWVNNGLGIAHHIRMDEWQQERDKMKNKCNESGCGVMTLGEAIDHANEKSIGSSQCAAQHAQLAKWLTDYRAMLAAAPKLGGE